MALTLVCEAVLVTRGVSEDDLLTTQRTAFSSLTRRVTNLATRDQ
ncbi:hypothetical protein [Allorhodopirellula solitaria]|nr:hypothetical protein [Allorhodopirellula solitaria]